MIKKAKEEINKNIIIEEPKIIEKIDFPVNIFPSIIKDYINDVSVNANFSKDFLSVSVISAISTVLGQTVNLKVNNTWKTSPIFWFAVVGGPGSKKSHPVKFALRPLKNLDINNKKEYDEEKDKYDVFIEMSDKDKKQYVANYGNVKKPNYLQYVVKDATIEALYYVHDINRNGILLYKDELIGFIKGMGQYKSNGGDEMEQYLSLFDGDELKKNRVTKEPLLIPNTCVNLIGTIQPDVLNKIPRENGFLQRFLFTNADTEIKRFNTNEVNIKIINDYEDFVLSIQKNIYQLTEKIEYVLSPEARTEFFNIDNYLCNLQESEETDKFLSQYIEKLKTYLPRFALIISIMNNIYIEDNEAIVDKKNLEDSFKLIKYFLSTIKKLLYEQNKSEEIKEVSSKLYGLTTAEKVYELNKKGISKVKIADQVGISRQQVYNILKTLKNEK